MGEVKQARVSDPIAFPWTVARSNAPTQWQYVQFLDGFGNLQWRTRNQARMAAAQMCLFYRDGSMFRAVPLIRGCWS